MFKFLLILFLIAYLLSKIGGFFFKAGAASQRRNVDGNISTDPAPKKEKRNGTIKGGDYIDYEEV